jgi:hypothetical protein
MLSSYCGGCFRTLSVQERTDFVFGIAASALEFGNDDEAEEVAAAWFLRCVWEAYESLLSTTSRRGLSHDEEMAWARETRRRFVDPDLRRAELVERSQRRFAMSNRAAPVGARRSAV